MANKYNPFQGLSNKYGPEESPQSHTSIKFWLSISFLPALSWLQAYDLVP